jgi:hypothetical protein
MYRILGKFYEQDSLTATLDSVGYQFLICSASEKNLELRKVYCR